MTAPLCADGIRLAASTPPQRHARTAKTVAFALPDLAFGPTPTGAGESPIAELADEQAGADAELPAPMSHLPLPATEPMQAEPPPMLSMELLPPGTPTPPPETETGEDMATPPAALVASEAPPLRPGGQARTATAMPAAPPTPAPPAPPAAGRATTPQTPPQAAKGETPAGQAPAPHRAAVAQAAPSGSPAAESAGQFSGQFSDQSSGQTPQSPAKQPQPAPAAADAAAQTTPFRLEMPQAMAPAAVERGAASPALALAAHTPDMAGDALSPMPDVVVGLVGEKALDVTISAATADSLERLTAAEPELRHQLAELGAEVEAIRMELRPEPGPEKGPEKGGEQGADRLHASATDEAGGRQGDRMMRHTAREDWHQRGGRAPQPAGSGMPAQGPAPAPAPGRIDRYA